MIIVGGKFGRINLNRLIDSFDRIVRCNMALPNGYNGENTDIIYLNNHLYINVFKNRKTDDELFSLYPHTDKIFLEKLSMLTKKIHVLEMMETNNKKSNKILKKLNIEGFSGQPRCGIQAVLYCISKKETSIFLSGFSITDDNDNTAFYNNIKSIYEKHKPDEEFRVIKQLHEKGIIDATFCLLRDSEKPILDCKLLKPSSQGIELLQKYVGEVTLINYNGEELKHLIKKDGTT